MPTDARAATAAGGINPDVFKQGIGVHAARLSAIGENVKPAPHRSGAACLDLGLPCVTPTCSTSCCTATGRLSARLRVLGILSAPPEQRPHALEIVFETPALAPMDAQVKATVAAVKRILAEYRELQAYAANL